MEKTDIQSGIAFIYVGGCKETTDEEKLTNFLERNGISGDIKCERLETKGINRAFKVCVQISELQKIYSPDLWPRGLTVRRFQFRRPRNNDAEI